MKKFFIAVAALALGAGTLFAQNAKLEKPFYLGKKFGIIGFILLALI